MHPRDRGGVRRGGVRQPRRRSTDAGAPARGAAGSPSPAACWLTPTTRTAGCGPARSVVWEGSGRANPATPDPDLASAARGLPGLLDRFAARAQGLRRVEDSVCGELAAASDSRLPETSSGRPGRKEGATVAGNPLDGLVGAAGFEPENRSTAAPTRPLSLAPERLLTVREVAGVLGVSTATVYRLCHEQALVHVRIANAVRLRPSDLASFVALRRR